MTVRPRSLVLVGVQLATLVYLAATGPLLATPRWVGLEIAGLVLGTWAVLVIGPRRLRVFPEIGRAARLVTRGPYRLVRHPMYTAVLLISAAVVIDRPTVARLVAWLVLLGDLLLKIQDEEEYLRRRFPEYQAYRRRTKRLVPWVY